MTPRNPQPRPCGDVSPCAPLHGWRLWVRRVTPSVVAVLAIAYLLSLPVLVVAADHYANARRHAVHQGE